MSGNTWSRDEYLVTLDLYLNKDNIVEDQTDPDVQDIADLIDRTPGAVALRLANYRHLDPRSTEGMSHVSKGCREIWEEYYRNEEELEHEAELAKQRLRESGESPKGGGREGETEVGVGETEISGTGRTGQGDFRSVIRSRYDDECLLCDVSTPGLLQASHILDWSEFEDLRGEPDNGMLLCYTHHRAFDLGIFTISGSYEVEVRPGFSDDGTFLERTLFDQEQLHFSRSPPSEEYLSRHNERLDWWPPEEAEE